MRYGQQYLVSLYALYVTQTTPYQHCYTIKLQGNNEYILNWKSYEPILNLNYFIRPNSMLWIIILHFYTVIRVQ